MVKHDFDSADFADLIPVMSALDTNPYPEYRMKDRRVDAGAGVYDGLTKRDDVIPNSELNYVGSTNYLACWNDLNKSGDVHRPLWNPGQVENLIYQSLPVVAAVVHASRNGFKNTGRIQAAIRGHVIPAYKAWLEQDNAAWIKMMHEHNPGFEMEYVPPTKLTDEEWEPIRRSLSAAAPLLADWAMACICYEVSFWSSLIGKQMTQINEEIERFSNDGSTSTGLILKSRVNQQPATSNLTTSNQSESKQGVSSGKQPATQSTADKLAEFKRNLQERASSAASTAASPTTA